MRFQLEKLENRVQIQPQQQQEDEVMDWNQSMRSREVMTRVKWDSRKVAVVCVRVFATAPWASSKGRTPLVLASSSSP
jgi:hypothetical protein